MQVVELVSHFESMTAKQIRGALYPRNASATPCDRALARLCTRGYLARFRWRHDGAVVYQLGPEGWRFIGHESPYKALTAFSRHKLAIADTFVSLLALQHAGRLEVLEFACEPDVWVRVRNTELRPDLYVRIKDLRSGAVTRWFLEVDLASEHKNQIKEKVRRYVRAFHDADGESSQWSTWPVTLFVVRDEIRGQDEKRCDELRRWINEAAEVRELFQACSFDDLQNVLLTQ